MNKKLRRTLLVAGSIGLLAGGGAAIAGATGGGNDDADQPITGSELDRAKAAALEQTGGGQVTATEIRDEEGYYEVEVRRGDGSQVDVHLDRNFNVLGEHPEGSGSDENAAGED
jgi:uncharacterized membrane protein YkoI